MKNLIKMIKCSNKISHDDLFNSLITMIKWTRQFKEKINYDYKHPLIWAKEFSTIKFCVSRQSGHTSFLKKIIGEYGPNGTTNKDIFKNPVIIMPNYRVACNLKLYPEWSWIGLANDNQNKFFGRKIDGVIIDCSSILSKREVDNIYNMFKNNSFDSQFIFVFLE